MFEFLYNPAPNPALFLLSIVSGVVAWSVILLMAGTKTPGDARNRWLEILLAVHVFRYIGLVALVPTHVDPAPFGWSQAYLAQVAYGDWVAGILAAITIVAIRADWSKAIIPLAWTFAIIGTADTINAGASIVPQIRDQNLVTPLGWIILTLYVPALVVTEILVFAHLIRRAFPKPVASKAAF